MLWLALALQVADHGSRDFTQEGLSPLAGTHVNVRTETVTTLGEVGPCREPGIWHEHQLALSPRWGSVRVEFLLDTITPVDASLAGWFVDDMELVAAPSGAIPPGMAAGSSNSPDRAFCGARAGAVDPWSTALPLALLSAIMIFLVRRRP